MNPADLGASVAHYGTWAIAVDDVCYQRPLELPGVHSFFRETEIDVSHEGFEEA
jgi:hypothetical protein